MKRIEAIDSKMTDLASTNTYGNKSCYYCQLTIAEFMNGGAYLLPDQLLVYAHIHCAREPTAVPFLTRNTKKNETGGKK